MPARFLCSHTWEQQLYVNKHEAKCSLLNVRHFLAPTMLYTTKI